MSGTANYGDVILVWVLMCGERSVIDLQRQKGRVWMLRCHIKMNGRSGFFGWRETEKSVKQKVKIIFDLVPLFIMFVFRV